MDRGERSQFVIAKSKVVMLLNIYPVMISIDVQQLLLANRGLK